MSSLVLNPATVFQCSWPHTSFIFWPGWSPPYSSSLPVPCFPPSPQPSPLVSHCFLLTLLVLTTGSAYNAPSSQTTLILLRFHFAVGGGTITTPPGKARVSSHGSHNLCLWMGDYTSEGFAQYSLTSPSLIVQSLFLVLDWNLHKGRSCVCLCRSCASGPAPWRCSIKVLYSRDLFKEGRM